VVNFINIINIGTAIPINSGLFCKIILILVSDDHEGTLYYKIIVMITSASALLSLSVINSDHM